MQKNEWKLWPMLFLLTSLMTYSCQNFEKNQRNDIQSENIATTIDSNHWLRETRGIRDILKDLNGNIWFSSPDYIAKFDGIAMNYFSENDGLNIVGNIHEDAEGKIWIEDGHRIFRYNGNSFLEEKFDNINTSSGLWVQRGLNLKDTNYVHPGIYRLNRQGSHFFNYPIERDANNKYLYYPTTKVALGKDSIVWVGTMEKVFGLKNDSFISIGREEMGRQMDERHMGIRGIFVDRQENLWIADNGAGVFVYDGENVENFSQKHSLDQGDVKGNTLHRAFSIEEDVEGNIWFGTVYSGIWMYNPNTKKFKNFSKDHGVKSECIWTIYKTREGELLFAGETPAAVYRFNGNSFDRIF